MISDGSIIVESFTEGKVPYQSQERQYRGNRIHNLPLQLPSTAAMASDVEEVPEHFKWTGESRVVTSLSLSHLAEGDVLRQTDDPGTSNVVVSNAEWSCEKGSRKRIPSCSFYTGKHAVLGQFIFLCMGITSLFGWNALLNSLDSLTTFIYPTRGPSPDSTIKGNFHDTITACYTTSNLLVTAWMFWKGSLDPLWIRWGTLTTAFSLLGVALTCQIITSRVVGVLILHILCLILGGCTGGLAATAFSLASNMSESFIVVVSAGVGWSGLVTFGLWMLPTHLLQPHDKVFGTRRTIWILYGFGIGMALFVVVSFQLFNNIVSYNIESTADLSTSSSSLKEEKELQDRLPSSNLTREFSLRKGYEKKPETQMSSVCVTAEQKVKVDENLSFLQVFFRCKSQWINIFLTFWVTLLVFPTVGPFGWTASSTETDILMGVFQIGDLVGRYLPSFRKKVHLFALSPKILIYFVAARAVLIGTFCLTFRFPEALIWGEFWFKICQMAILSISNGWFTTLAMMYLPICVNGKEARSRAACLGPLGLLTGATLGQWMAKLLILG